MTVLGAFLKLRKETISFLMSVHMSVCPRETFRLPLDGFSWNLIFEYFSETRRKIHVWLKYKNTNGYFAGGPMIIYDQYLAEFFLE